MKDKDFVLLEEDKVIKELEEASEGKIYYETNDKGNVIKLEGGSNEIRSIPESISRLKHLERLDLGGNKITKLPESIGELKNLKVLILEGCYLTELPDSIGNLSQLRRLYLTDNDITTLPESLNKLKLLEIFEISNIPLDRKKIPDSYWPPKIGKRIKEKREDFLKKLKSLPIDKFK